MGKDIGIYLLSAGVFSFMFFIFNQAKETKEIEKDLHKTIETEKKKLKELIKDKTENIDPGDKQDPEIEPEPDKSKLNKFED